jgi:UPF0716 family protein affecting phage T7 exclusion
MQTLARTREIMPDSTLSKGASALAASLLMVEPELVWGLIAVVILNAIASLWYAIRTDDRTALTVVRWLILRVGVYLLVMPSVLILSTIVGVDLLQRIAFGAAAGWEVAVTMGLCARLSPRFRPVYEAVVTAIDEHTPADLTEDDVTDAIDRDRTDCDRPD